MDKPTVYILHGDDTFGIQRALDGMLAKMGDPSMAELNTSRLDGREAADEAVRSAANSMPFLAERRMVILTHPFARLNSEAARARFRELLDGLPEFHRPGAGHRGCLRAPRLANLAPDHWLRRWMESAGSRAYYQLCQLPSPQPHAEWVRKEAREPAGSCSLEAAAALVDHVGNDTRTASLEIEKLLALRRPPARGGGPGRGRTVTARGGQADVFQMVDAMVGRKRPTGTKLATQVDGRGRRAQSVWHGHPPVSPAARGARDAR